MKPDYAHAIAWIIYHRGGGGGHRRALVIQRVSGWLVTQLVADMFGKSCNEVALDVIALDRKIREGDDEARRYRVAPRRTKSSVHSRC